MPTSIAASVLADNPFFVVTGLPVHTLVVHFAVSMLPLSAIALIVIVLVPRWRGAFEWATLIGLIIGTGAAFVSKESGEALAEVVGLPQTHAKWGDLLPYVALLLLAVGLLWAWLARRAPKQDPLPRISLGSGAELAVSVVTIGLALIAIGMTVVVGHTGAEAVWSSRDLGAGTSEVAPSVAPSATSSGGATASASASAAAGYTMAAVAKHATAADCWSAISGNVYDLTQWIPQHPGGPGVIEALCGTNGTKAFEGQHRGDTNADAALQTFLLGPVSS